MSEASAFTAQVTSEAGATGLARAILGRSVTVTARTPLDGGKINQVEHWRLDCEPHEVVAKIDGRGQHGAIAREGRCLSYYRAHTAFPVPAPLGHHAAGETDGVGDCLLMECLPGRHMGGVALDKARMNALQDAIADAVAALHRHTRARYGHCTDPDGPPGWTEAFRTRLRAARDGAAPRLEADTLDRVDAISDNLDWLLDGGGVPSLVHGDLWFPNIIIDDADPARPCLSGFVDPRGEFCDPEFELAYLNCFGDEFARFFARYREHHPERPGFPERCRLYWLHTMLVHVWIFGGGHFNARTVALAQEIASKNALKAS